MRPQDFTANAPGRLEPIPEGTIAFVPNPVPRGLSFPMSTMKLVDQASRAMGELAGVGQMLPNLQLLSRPFQRREAILSSRIEGTIASMEQLVLFEVEPQRNQPQVQEVLNYFRAIEHGLQRLADIPLSLRLVRELHEILMRDVRGEEARPGEFRTIQNHIGRLGQPVTEARFVPPPPGSILECFHDLEAFWHEETDYPALVQIALAHYQFETIHPFRDGNGRIGRLLILLDICGRGILPAPLLYISAYLEEHREEYMRRLLRVSQAGEWTAWVEFFLRGMTAHAQDALGQAKALRDLREEYRRRVQLTRASASTLGLVDALFNTPVITATGARDLLEVTHATALQAIGRLEELGIVQEVTGNKRNRVYVAQGIIHVSRS